MLIANARVAKSAASSTHRHLHIRGDRLFFTKPRRDAIDLSDHLILPGLINAHDHLEFNLFPRLGRRIYTNATEWAEDIHHPQKSPVRENLQIPKRDRLLWGGLRNLLSGVTTVAHHNPYHEVFDHAFPVRVLRGFGWAHSIAFSPEVLARYQATPSNQPFIIHAAEGTDAAARAEIGELDRLGILSDRTLLVHALALDQNSLELIRSRRSSIAWCPSSNLLTYGRTLRAHRLRAVRIALGTDSAISAAGDMADELRLAHTRCGAAPEVLYRMVTDQPAKIFGLTHAGALRHRGIADFIAIPDRGQTPAEALLDLRPELVVVGGSIRLVSKNLQSRFARHIDESFHPIALEDRGEWLTPFDIPNLRKNAEGALGPEIRLAGKRVLT